MPVGKGELLSRITASRDHLASLFAAIPDTAFLQPSVIGRWSARDLLAHFVAHEQRALSEIAAARRGERLAIDAAGTDEFNAGAVFAWASLPPAEARAAWDRSYRRVIETIEALADADFAPGSALEHALGDTVDGALANNTYAHYSEHLPELEAFVARCRQALERGGSMHDVQHISVSIARPPAEVYEFASDPRNMSRWAAGLARFEIKKAGDEWIADAPFGKVRVRFAPRNSFGVMDHDVTLESGVTVHNPMRVMPNGDGSEFVFTLIRRPEMSDEQFAKDKAAVEHDLKTLKQLLERGS